MALISKKRRLLKFCLRLAAIISFALALLAVTTGIQYKTVNFVHRGDAVLDEMNTSDIYELSDINVIDLYATVTGENESRLYLVAVNDKDGSKKYATLISDSDDGELFEDLKNDLSEKAGNYVIGGCFSADSLNEAFDFSDIEYDKLKEAYFDFVSNYQQKLNVKQTNLVLDFKFASESDFKAYEKSVLVHNIKGALAAAMLFAGGIIFISLAVSMSRRDKKRIAENLINNGVYFDPVRQRSEADADEYESSIS